MRIKNCLISKNIEPLLCSIRIWHFPTKFNHTVRTPINPHVFNGRFVTWKPETFKVPLVKISKESPALAELAWKMQLPGKGYAWKISHQTGSWKKIIFKKCRLVGDMGQFPGGIKDPWFFSMVSPMIYAWFYSFRLILCPVVTWCSMLIWIAVLAQWGTSWWRMSPFSGLQW